MPPPFPRIIAIFAAAALASCGEKDPALLGEVTARQWLGDDGCEVTVPFTGVPYEGECDGCTYAFSVELPTPDPSCLPWSFYALDGTVPEQTFVVAFDPEGWTLAYPYSVHDDYEFNAMRRVEEVFYLLDERSGGYWGATAGLGAFSSASNALEGQFVAFDGATLEATRVEESAETVNVERHLWDECAGEVDPTGDGVASVPDGATVVEVSSGDTVREWRYTFALAGPAEVGLAAVSDPGGSASPDIAVYLTDPDGCLVGEGWRGDGCPTAEQVCASTTVAVDQVGVWSAVVGVGGSAQASSVRVWVTVDGEVSGLTPEEAGHEVWGEEEVATGTSWTVSARVDRPHGSRSRVPGCDLADVAFGLAGAGAVDCGVVPPWGDRTDVDACTVRGLGAGTPFVALYEYEGMAMGATSAIVGTSDGAVLMTTRRATGDPDGPVGVQQTFCSEPFLRPGGAGDDVVTCPPPRQGACTCFDEGCSAERCCG